MTDFLHDSQALWNRHAAEDPLWAILSDPAKKDRAWNLARFFQTGVGEIEGLLYELTTHGLETRRESALDFGCGVGRLTQALARHFTKVVGVDIAPRMIAMARTLNRFPERVTYEVNSSPDLASLRHARFDLIVTRLTLQHIAPDIAVLYLASLCRALTAGGVLVAQLPSHARPPAERSRPSTVSPMPDEAYSATIACQGVIDGTLQPGARITLDLLITNRGPIAWSQADFGRMTVGNHWLDAATNRMLVRDDGRTGIPERVVPGETCRVPLTVTLPADVGDYLCELDVSHEGLRWFHDKGSEVERVAVRVGPSDAVVLTQPGQPAALTDADLDAPSGWDAGAIGTSGRTAAVGESEGVHLPAEPFPMFGVPQEVVLDVVARCGADVFHVEDDRSCGHDWVSYQYFVRGPA